MKGFQATWEAPEKSTSSTWKRENFNFFPFIFWISFASLIWNKIHRRNPDPKHRFSYKLRIQILLGHCFPKHRHLFLNTFIIEACLNLEYWLKKLKLQQFFMKFLQIFGKIVKIRNRNRILNSELQMGSVFRISDQDS